MLEDLLKPLAELSKPITKLIETISSGIYTCYEPIYIKRIANAKAEEMKVLAKAKADSMVIENEVLKNYYIELEEQKLLREHHKKENRDKIVLRAAEILKDKTVNDIRVDADWVNQFFIYSENVSNEEMQSIWSRVLAGEVQKPNSYSKRALFTISIMSENIAKSFLSVGEYSFQNSKGDVILSQWMGNYLKENCGDYALRNSTNILHGLGLMHIYNIPNDLTFARKAEREIKIVMKGCSFTIKLDRELQENYSIGGQMFTQLGKELYQLLGSSSDKKDYITEYYKMAQKDLERKGIKTQLEFD